MGGNDQETKMPIVKENEVAALFAEDKIGDYTIKPWTLKQFQAVYPALKIIVAKLLEQGLTVENLDTFFLERGLEAMEAVLPELPQLIAATLRLDLKEAEEMDWGLAAVVGMKILLQNTGPLKNLSSLAAGRMPGAGTATL
ncbi:MAG: hypothetical protein PHU44_00135 [Syntrophales bacterium]|nr:hypothetical protein [Syntrophales bacterium]MDD5640109.1 hypothetical protein [Syntrophales bacterium]